MPSEEEDDDDEDLSPEWDRATAQSVFSQLSGAISHEGYHDTYLRISRRSRSNSTNSDDTTSVPDTTPIAIRDAHTTVFPELNFNDAASTRTVE